MLPLTRLAVLCLFTLAALGCSHGSAATRKAAPLALAPANPANGLLVLYRNVGGFMGGGAMMNATVRLDDKAVGDLGQDTYGLLEVSPAEHSVTFRGASGESTVLVTVGPGEVRYVQVVTYPSMSSSLRAADLAHSELDNEGEPLKPGLKYTAPGAIHAAAPANTSSM